jgi:hypothetical protein
LLLVESATNAQQLPLGDCSREPNLAGRDDIVMCEPWETESWWSDHGYVESGGIESVGPVSADQMTLSSIISADCLSGQCLQLEAREGNSRSLSIHWPLAAAGLEPQELYFRYYFKIGADWTPQQCDASGATVFPPGGKFPGFADARGTADPVGQCGNGGNSSDGINCWSARGVFHGCEGGYTAADGFPFENTCDATPGARTRIGTYLYTPNNDATHGANALWDNVAERNTMGDDFSSACRRTDPENPDPECYCQATNNLYCGIGTGGQLVTGRWYAVETYVKMNTPGIDDGIIRGWIDDELAYEKTNVLFRLPGHDNLHVRTLWLDVYKGGSGGNCEDSFLYYDQMVIATRRIGGIGPKPRPPTNLVIGQ